MLIAAGFFAMLPLGALLNALALSAMWNWYVAPFLHVAALDMLHAFAFSLIVSVFRDNTPKEAPDLGTEIETFGKLLGATVFGPLFVIAAGWLGTFLL